MDLDRFDDAYIFNGGALRPAMSAWRLDGPSSAYEADQKQDKENEE